MSPPAALRPEPPGDTRAAAPAPSQAASASREPRWIREHPLLREGRQYLRTLAAITVHPARFAREWADGQPVGMNPLTMTALSSALLGFLHKLERELGGAEAPLTYGQSFWQSLLPYFHYLLLGAICHLILRLGGSRRALTSTAAMALYAGAGPFTALGVLILGAKFALHFGGVELPSFISTDYLLHAEAHRWLLVAFTSAAMVGFLVFLVSFVRLLSGLHGARWWHSLLALVIAVLLSAWLYAALGIHLPGDVFQPVRFG